MDVLSDVLAAVRLTGAIFFDHHFRFPFAGASPPTSVIGDNVMPGSEHVIAFHAVLSGSVWAALTDDPASSVRLEAGDVVILPMGDANIVGSAPELRAEAGPSRYERPVDRPLPWIFYHEGEGPERAHAICGYLGCDARPFNPLLDALPRLFRAEMSAASQSWLAEVLRVAADESELGGVGSETILARLAEAMFVEVVRKHVTRLPEDARGWLSALRDRHVGQALRLIHGKPARDWSIETLAREVGLSRSVFAERFSHYVGVSPMHYLARWRMQLAARRLASPGVSIAQAGSEVGYESEAAFSRAFKKHVGLPPGAWRSGRSPARAERRAAMRACP
jgi:AraC-like DNA-binding protein